MRTKRAMYNMAASLVGQLSLVLVTLISRRIFLRTLGADYLGANTLFANILAFLSMAELGIGSAINYSLYKPIAEDDREQIKSLMQLYRYAYWAIGVFILVAGLLLTPVVPLIATGGEGIAHLRLVYLLFLVNTAVSYFFSYKSAFIIADQRKYVFTLNHYGWQLAMYLVQIFVLLHWQNYFAYLLIQVAVTVLENAMIAAIVDKNYPFLKEKNVRPLAKATLTEMCCIRACTPLWRGWATWQPPARTSASARCSTRLRCSASGCTAGAALGCISRCHPSSRCSTARIWCWTVWSSL